VAAAGETGGIGPNSVRVWTASVGHFEIGDEKIQNMRVRIASTFMGDIDMLLGIDFFLTHRVYVANGRGKMYFANDEPNSASSAQESDLPGGAKEYAQRGAALAARREFERALADLTRACELEPGVAQYFLLRGRIQASLGHLSPALSDFNEALRLDPNDANARLTRARMHIFKHDAESARADLDAADRVAASQATTRWEMGQLYFSLGLLDAALDQYNKWIAAHDQDLGLATALNDRCWVRALLGRELDQALQDCDAAVGPRPISASFLDSRGLVHLRRGEFDEALNDYDAALSINPKLAWSLYGRGLIRLRKGATDAGNADISNAGTIRPSIAADAKRYGID
jgi:tetratricopeptide (TPR) repeat protein